MSSDSSGLPADFVAATDGPRVIATRAELRSALSETRRAGAPVGFVPTMGALQQGHASLMAHARDLVTEGTRRGPVVVSVFVNPLQFGAGEDLDRYPRTLAADVELCAAEGVDFVFVPAVDEVYPGGMPQVRVDPGPLGSQWEGASRPGHFAGVLTVVAKLFGLVAPDVAVFGEKDYQQLTLIRRMVADLCMPVDVVGAPTIREADGLAMSSRNRYLDEAQRAAAGVLSRALRAAQANASAGLAAARAAAEQVLAQEPGAVVDYLAFTTPDLEQLTQIGPGTPARALIAAKVGSTRLIDNIDLQLG